MDDNTCKHIIMYPATWRLVDQSSMVLSTHLWTVAEIARVLVDNHSTWSWKVTVTNNGEVPTKGKCRTLDSAVDQVRKALVSDAIYSYCIPCGNLESTISKLIQSTSVL